MPTFSRGQAFNSMMGIAVHDSKCAGLGYLPLTRPAIHRCAVHQLFAPRHGSRNGSERARTRGQAPTDRLSVNRVCDDGLQRG
jgi:hypothetical protein